MFKIFEAFHERISLPTVWSGGGLDDAGAEPAALGVEAGGDDLNDFNGSRSEIDFNDQFIIDLKIVLMIFLH